MTKIDRDAGGRYLRDDAVIANALREVCDCLYVAIDALSSMMSWIEPYVNGDIDETMHRLHDDRIDEAKEKVWAIRAALPAIDEGAANPEATRDE